MRNGFDWSADFPGIPALRASGASFVGRYAAFDHPRGISADEVNQLTAAGMDILTYYEESSSWIMGGYSAGVRAAQNARQAWAAAGQHTDVPLFLAADSDYDSSQLAPIYDALDGCASVIGRQNTGIYGGVVPVHCARRDGKATYGVQAGAWRYRAGEVGVTDPYGWSPLAQVRQDGYNVYVGYTSADHLTALAGDFGQWRRGAVLVDVKIDATPWDPTQWDHNATCKKGDSGEQVGWIQYVLNSALGTKIAIQSPPMFDAATTAGVKALQMYGKLGVDGVVGPVTWHVLGAYVARVHRYDLCPTLAFGATESSSKGKLHVLQQALNMVSVHGFTPVGGSVFDTHLRDCVVQYQRNRHLTADGVVGPNTWADLGALVTRYGH